MSTLRPTLESLRFLEASVRHGSFTRAAAELCVSSAAVSLRIRQLEQQLGKRLFLRSGPRVTPTEAGIKLANRIADALGLVATAVDECVEASRSLRVTAVPTFAMRWLAPRLPRYHSLVDSISIDLNVSTELQHPHNFDVAVRTGLGRWPNLDATALMPVEATAMLSPVLVASSPLSSPEDLLASPLLPHEDWSRWFHEAGATVSDFRFSGDDYPIHDMNASAAIDGAGVALLSPTFYGSLVREGKLIQPFTHTIRGPKWHYLLINKGDRRPALRRFRDWLVAEAGAFECASEVATRSIPGS